MYHQGSNMNEKFNFKNLDLLHYLLGLWLVIALVWGGVSTIKSAYYRSQYQQSVSKYESLLGQYRESVDNVRNVEQELRSTVRQSNECISNARGSIQELRAGLSELQRYFESMEESCDRLRDYSSLGNNSNNNSEGK